MDNAENLVDRILGDGEILKNNIISDATKKADEIISVASQEVDKIINGAKSQSDVNYSDIISRGKTVAELDSKKIILQAKKQLIEQCFERAKNKICELSNTEYLKFITKLIKQYGEDGDEVIVSDNDAKRITSDAISKIASSCKMKLKLSKEKANFIGGIILKNGGEYKNLTVEMLIFEKYSDLEMQVLSKLNI